MSQKLLSFLKKFWHRIIFIAMGAGSLTWFLIRIIPKPSRAAYPCMKASFPIASTFLLYLLGITSVTFFAKKAKEKFIRSKYIYFILFAVLGLSAGVWTLVNNSSNASALQAPQTGNQPIGEGKGIYPGRVVWAHDPLATRKACTNDVGDYWSSDANTDQTVVNSMVSNGIRTVAGATTDAEAWDKIFKYYNNTHGRGYVGYSAGEKIVIKINLNGEMNSYTSTPPKNINTSPQLCYAILYQLVNVVGVTQANITIGDPNVGCNQVTWNKCHAAFPNVRIWGSGTGMVPVVGSANEVLKASNGSFSDKLPQEFLDAAYEINLPVFKKHHRAGISIGCKNHFGTIGSLTDGANHLHASLPCPDASGAATNGNYGVYRCFVDIMGHKDLGGKTIITIVDGIWGSTNWGHPPVKWEMAPFSNDYPNSLFISLDPVALESVCFDFLYNEFDEDHPTEGIFVGDDKGPFPHFEGTDDYLHQAADTNNWPSTVHYDPENDGSRLKSMGTHEHWNNPTNKQYSRNLGETEGIELVMAVDNPLRINNPNNNSQDFVLCYPNPFESTTNITYCTANNGILQLNIYNTSGQLIRTLIDEYKDTGEGYFIWDGKDNMGNHIAVGNYFYQLKVKNSYSENISGQIIKVSE